MTKYRAAVKWECQASPAEIRRAIFTDVPIMVSELIETGALWRSDVEALCDELIAIAEDAE